MKISELITRLWAHIEEYGDIEVRSFDPVTQEYYPVENPLEIGYDEYGKFLVV